MPPTLHPVFTYRAFISKPDTLALGATKGGAHRICVPVTDGFLRGTGKAAGIDFEIVQGGSDWPRADPGTRIIHLDSRFNARNTETGEVLYGYYPGITRPDPEMQKCLERSPEARTTEGREHYWVMTPTFEVSGEGMKWMEQTVFVAHGHWFVPGDGRQAVEYEVYKVVSG
ncbi:hypothetical protein LTR09_011688 [Extremus antarcticus]|uniref:Uncharacterized protein n=1 Tax=Extremus antarcticus TaxID=702011 RepID=A0AAJ0DBA8_9PEZI|nr:hypothetical protein LTR09_011688 [Extremus antarcticus]